MEFQITKQLLKFLLRFRCPNCEFRSYEVAPIQRHLRHCQKEDDKFDENKFEQAEEEFELDIKEDLIENDIPFNPPNLKMKGRVKASTLCEWKLENMKQSWKNLSKLNEFVFLLLLI